MISAHDISQTSSNWACQRIDTPNPAGTQSQFDSKRKVRKSCADSERIPARTSQLLTYEINPLTDAYRLMQQ